MVNKNKNNLYKNLCKDCRGSIKFKNDFVCVFCDSKSTAGKTCPWCTKTCYLDQLLSASEYGGIVRKTIKEMKYRYIKDVANDFSVMLSGFALKQIKNKHLEFIGNELIIPVPLGRFRFNYRGFNQAEIMARKVASDLKLDLATNVLTRKKIKMPQADIKEKMKRFENATGVYSINGGTTVKNKTVWLVDDVSTTGATLNDCARALKEAGTIRVVGLTMAKGKLKNFKRIT